MPAGSLTTARAEQNHAAPPSGRVVEAAQQTGHLAAAAEITLARPFPRLRRPGEPGRLLQDRLVKVTQLSARIDAQVLLQDLAQPTECVQGLRLTPVPVQREHQLTPPPLPQRAVRHQGLEPADNLVVVT
jgi:hypothetical protein